VIIVGSISNEYGAFIAPMEFTPSVDSVMNALNKEFPSPLEHVKVAHSNSGFSDEDVQKVKNAHLTSRKVQYPSINLETLGGGQSMLRMVEIAVAVDHVRCVESNSLRNAKISSKPSAQGDYILEYLRPVGLMNHYAADNEVIRTSRFNQSGIAGFVGIDKVHIRGSQEFELKKAKRIICALLLKGKTTRLLGLDSDL
jgi:hypothetical protein